MGYQRMVMAGYSPVSSHYSKCIEMDPKSFNKLITAGKSRRQFAGRN